MQNGGPKTESKTGDEGCFVLVALAMICSTALLNVYIIWGG